eukprot:817854_1
MFMCLTSTLFKLTVLICLLHIRCSVTQTDASAFGIFASSDSIPTTSTIIRLLLSWNKEQWECMINETFTQSVQYYMCTSGDFEPNATLITDSLSSNAYEMKIELIQNTANDSIRVDSVRVVDDDVNHYDIDTFCLPEPFQMNAARGATSDRIRCCYWYQRYSYNSYVMDDHLKISYAQFRSNVLSYDNQAHEGAVKPPMITELGITTLNIENASSSSLYTLTLHWDINEYTTTLQPNASATTFTQTISDSAFCEFSSGFHLEITSSADDSLGIDTIVIKDESGYYYNVDMFCKSTDIEEWRMYNNSEVFCDDEWSQYPMHYGFIYNGTTSMYIATNERLFYNADLKQQGLLLDESYSYGCDSTNDATLVTGSPAVTLFKDTMDDAVSTGWIFQGTYRESINAVNCPGGSTDKCSRLGGYEASTSIDSAMDITIDVSEYTNLVDVSIQYDVTLSTMPSGKRCYVYYAFDDGAFVSLKYHSSSSVTLQSYYNQSATIPDHTDASYENLTIRFLNNALYDNEYCYVDNVYIFVDDLYLDFDDCDAFDSSWTNGGASVRTSSSCPMDGTCVYLNNDWAIKTFNISRYNNLVVAVDFSTYYRDYCIFHYFYDDEPLRSLGSFGYYSYPSSWMKTRNKKFSIPDSTMCGSSTLSIRFSSSHECQIDNIVLLGNILDTKSPTMTPTTNPTTQHPTSQTSYPTQNPTNHPTIQTENPSFMPTVEPSTYPTVNPTTKEPTVTPTRNPTVDPTTMPTVHPTGITTKLPTEAPTSQPTANPSSIPTTQPTSDPTEAPSFDPTTGPTVDPSSDQTADTTNDPTSAADVTEDPTASSVQTLTTIDIYTTHNDVLFDATSLAAVEDKGYNASDGIKVFSTMLVIIFVLLCLFLLAAKLRPMFEVKVVVDENNQKQLKIHVVGRKPAIDDNNQKPPKDEVFGNVLKPEIVQLQMERAQVEGNVMERTALIMDKEQEGAGNGRTCDSKEDLHDLIKRQKEILAWFKDDVDLKESNMEYYDLFMKEGYDQMVLIADLTRDDLCAIGIKKRAHQNKILKAAEPLSPNSNAQHHAHASNPNSNIIDCDPYSAQIDAHHHLCNPNRSTDEKRELAEMVEIEIKSAWHTPLFISFSVVVPYCDTTKIKRIHDEALKSISWGEVSHIVSYFDSSYVDKEKESFYGGSPLWAHTDAFEIFMNQKITDYTKQEIENKGLRLVTTPGVQHKVNGEEEIDCGYLKQSNDINNPLLCPIYKSMKQGMSPNDERLEEFLKHLEGFVHLKNEFAAKTPCQHGIECDAFKRLEKGGNRFDDRAHIKLYRHPPRRNQNMLINENMHHFVYKNQLVESVEPVEDKQQYDETEENGIKNGYLQCLIQEVISNGFKRDLCLNEIDFENGRYSLLSIVEEKLKHPKHCKMGSPLDRGNMLALVLYTGCDSNYDLCKSQRNGDYKKWKWFDCCLWSATEFLSSNEQGSYGLFSGLSGAKLVMDKAGMTVEGFFPTYTSTSWNKAVAQTFKEGEGMILCFDKKIRRNGDYRCCDVSWISKFVDECEVLIARSTLAGSASFQFMILDETDDTQWVSIKSTV